MDYSQLTFTRRILLYSFIILIVFASYSHALTKFHIKLKPLENDCFQEFYNKKVVGKSYNYTNFIQFHLILMQIIKI